MHWRIEQIIDQMGGRGVRGALGYIGASEIAYHCRKDDSKPVNSTVDDHGLIEFEIGLMFRVNGKEREAWKMVVSLESDDTYTVRLFRKATPEEWGRKILAVVLDTDTDVYCDNLQAVVEGMYDQAIKKYNRGMIRIA